MAKKETKIKSEIMTTPIGIAEYPKLGEPDKKFVKEGVYTVRLKIDREEAAEMMELFNRLAEEHSEEVKAATKSVRDRKKIKLADPCYTPEYDEEGNETGYVCFNFKMQASGVTKEGRKWERRCPVYDAKLTPVDPKKIKIGSGSLMKVAYTVFPFYTQLVGAGISLRLEAVQIIELHEWGERDATSFGFGAEEGFVAEEIMDNIPFGSEGEEAVNEESEEAIAEGDF